MMPVNKRKYDAYQKGDDAMVPINKYKDNFDPKQNSIIHAII